MNSKLAFLGGDNSGKSELFYVLNDGSDFTHSTTCLTKVINGVEVSYRLWNVRQETTSSERGSQFSKTDVFIFCFSLHNRKSFEDIRTVWLPIAKEHPTIPVVLLGINTLPPQDAVLTHKEVNVHEIEDFQVEAGFAQYLECQIQASGAIDKFFKEISQQRRTVPDQENNFYQLEVPDFLLSFSISNVINRLALGEWNGQMETRDLEEEITL
jgi:GTPase SAR1 family protein